METIGGNTMYGYGQSSFPWEQGAGVGQGFAGSPVLGGDRVSNFSPPQQDAGFGGVGMEMMQTLMSWMAQLMQGMQGQNMGGVGQQAYFRNASLSSTGDPHDAITGSTTSGGQVSAKWDSMSSQDHLITSNGVAGGFNVATCVAPAKGGVTYNSSATITTNGGATIVTMAKGGVAFVLDNGQPVTLTAGQTSTLRNAQMVTLSPNGSLAVYVPNGSGGSINTTLSWNGEGVDVNANANNIALGGYLVNRQATPPATQQA
jgi:hypothetical protein